MRGGVGRIDSVKKGLVDEAGKLSRFIFIAKSFNAITRVLQCSKFSAIVKDWNGGKRRTRNIKTQLLVPFFPRFAGVGEHRKKKA